MICNVTTTCVVNRKGERKKKYKILNQDRRQFVLRDLHSHMLIPWGTLLACLHGWIISGFNLTIPNSNGSWMKVIGLLW